ncbi:DUF421 domain-containing protein [Bacillus sp. SG-1]|uniref:DUF421 domain-containing protein n=1 Tax=Bacillus sp. SG-1 TaxID=161544 RepID=UPI000154367C|nr:YetF domain-containing protein [Bacillus sp. SG-1]EDL65830.1 hypothetical protein BSG1_16280 [Bacillus sp. SG-1]
MFFSNFDTIERTIIIGLCAYVSLVILLRISGKRTLSKLNAFDFVITIAMGSTLSSILINKKVTLAQGTTAFIMLIGLQYVIAKLAVNVSFINKLIKSEPKILYLDGEYQSQAMKKERVLKKEIFQAARSQGISSMDEIDAVVLESDGSISIIKKSEQQSRETLNDVQGFER